MSSFVLKIFALFFMIIDHAGFILFPDKIIFRAIGRLAFPLFAYQMAVGFSHTKNKEKHIIKLLLFAILCQFPHTLMLNLYGIDMSLNIIFTFVISLLTISLLENAVSEIKSIKKLSIKTIVSSILSIFLIVLGCYLNVDYTWYGIILTTMFYFTLHKKGWSLILFFALININYFIEPSLMSLLAYVSMLDICLILLFNGKKGYNKSLIFYIVYFVHFFPLLALKHFLF